GQRALDEIERAREARRRLVRLAERFGRRAHALFAAHGAAAAAFDLLRPPCGSRRAMGEREIAEEVARRVAQHLDGARDLIPRLSIVAPAGDEPRGVAR